MSGLGTILSLLMIHQKSWTETGRAPYSIACWPAGHSSHAGCQLPASCTNSTHASTPVLVCHPQ